MKRFLMLVGVAVVAAAMYVAAGSASQQSKGVTQKQFKALKKQVATLSKTLKAVKSEADAALGIIGTCYLHQNADGTIGFTVMPVSQFGSTTSTGFLYGPNGGPGSPRTALDIATSSPQAYLQQVDPQCATVNGLRRTVVRSGASRLQRWAGTR